MDDKRIIDLYFARSENAIKETDAKYGKLLFGVSYGILGSTPDAEECVDDTYMSAWKVIPPQRPNYFSAFLSKIVRNISINRYYKNKRRYQNLVSDAILEEISECVSAPIGDVAEDIVIRDCINKFLSELSTKSRVIFVKRYFFMRSISQIEEETGVKSSTVKVTLSRLRIMLRERLEREGIYI